MEVFNKDTPATTAISLQLKFQLSRLEIKIGRIDKTITLPASFKASAKGLSLTKSSVLVAIVFTTFPKLHFKYLPK
jgi:hypothetical protein